MYSQRRTAKLLPGKMNILLMLVVVPFLNCDCKLVDLSHPFDSDTYYWSTAQPLKITVTFNGTRPGQGFWYQSESLCAGTTHSGTHMDAPCHFVRGGWCVSDIPIDRLVVRAVVVDIADDVGDDPDVHLTVKHLLEWENLHGDIPAGSLLLVRTGWSKHYHDRQKYLGTTEPVASLMRYPSITLEAARWITLNRRIVGIGIDSESIAKSDLSPDIHVTFLKHNIYGLENLNCLELLPPDGATVFALPLKLKGAGGAPVRVVAECTE